MFSKLIGNDVTKLTLRRLIHQNRLPNSLLFVGPEGTGKKQFAIETARALACRERTDSCHAGSANTNPAAVDRHEHPQQVQVEPMKGGKHLQNECR